MEALGIDVGGTGIKAAPVKIATGEFLDSRKRYDTPELSTPEALWEKISLILEHFGWSQKVGVGFPGVIRNGIVETAANLDNSWIGVPINKYLSERSGLEVTAINDADAAGLAEFRLGAGLGHPGTVILLTLGTGIGSALFHGGHLIPNSEFGHLELHRMVAEKYTANSVRKAEDLSWEEFGLRLNEYLHLVERATTPDLFIIGGGVSKKFDKFSPFFTLKTPVKPAQLLNQAGIVGAALATLPKP